MLSRIWRFFLRPHHPPFPFTTYHCNPHPTGNEINEILDDINRQRQGPVNAEQLLPVEADGGNPLDVALDQNAVVLVYALVSRNAEIVNHLIQQHNNWSEIFTFLNAVALINLYQNENAEDDNEPNRDALMFHFASDEDDEEMNQDEEQVNAEIMNIIALVPVDDDMDMSSVVSAIIVMLSDPEVMNQFIGRYTLSETIVILYLIVKESSDESTDEESSDESTDEESLDASPEDLSEIGEAEEESSSSGDIDGNGGSGTIWCAFAPVVIVGSVAILIQLFY